MRPILAALPLMSLLLPASALLPMSAAEAQVPGSYRQSCINVSQNGSILSARCRGSNGQLNETSIDVDQCRGQPVANNFGRLACGNVRGSSNPAQGYDRPRGGYEDQGVPRRAYRGGDPDAPPPGYGVPRPRPAYRSDPQDDAYGAPPPRRPRYYDPGQDD